MGFIDQVQCTLNLFEPPKETKIGLRNWEVRELEGKNVVFD